MCFQAKKASIQYINWVFKATGEKKLKKLKITIDLTISIWYINCAFHGKLTCYIKKCRIGEKKVKKT